MVQWMRINTMQELLTFRLSHFPRLNWWTFSSCHEREWQAQKGTAENEIELVFDLSRARLVQIHDNMHHHRSESLRGNQFPRSTTSTTNVELHLTGLNTRRDLFSQFNHSPTRLARYSQLNWLPDVENGLIKKSKWKFNWQRAATTCYMAIN